MDTLISASTKVEKAVKLSGKQYCSSNTTATSSYNFLFQCIICVDLDDGGHETKPNADTDRAKSDTPIPQTDDALICGPNTKPHLAESIGVDGYIVFQQSLRHIPPGFLNYRCQYIANIMTVAMGRGWHFRCKALHDSLYYGWKSPLPPW